MMGNGYLPDPNGRDVTRRYIGTRNSGAFSMRGGIWVLNIFAAIWFVVGVIGAGLPWAALVIPAAVSAR